MRTLTLILLFALAPVFARAGDVTITCSPPTQFTDGTPIQAGAVMTFRLYAGSLLDTQPRCFFTRTGLAPNTYNYTATALVDGVESDKSASAQIVVPSGPPDPPPIPTPLLTAGPFSYEPTGTAAAPTMSAIGLVDSGLSCGPVTRVVGTVKFCQITRAQTDLIGWPTDKTLKNGLWARAQ